LPGDVSAIALAKVEASGVRTTGEEFGLSQVLIGTVNGFFTNVGPKFESEPHGRIFSWRYLWLENIS
jgi:hypothetical protein